MTRKMELLELESCHICVDYLEGIIHVVPYYRPVDDVSKYYVCGLSIYLN